MDKEKYINYINSNVIEPHRFRDCRDYIEYCNITCILKFDFLDMELTKKLCEKKWTHYLNNSLYICYE